MKVTTKMMNTRTGRVLRRLLGEEKGAVAMEYIVIALLVGAAVVALVMVFSGGLRNSTSTISKTINAGTVDEVKKVGDEHKTQRQKLLTENTGANEGGDTIGGDFGTK